MYRIIKPVSNVVTLSTSTMLMKRGVVQISSSSLVSSFVSNLTTYSNNNNNNNLYRQYTNFTNIRSYTTSSSKPDEKKPQQEEEKKIQETTTDTTSTQVVEEVKKPVEDIVVVEKKPEQEQQEQVKEEKEKEKETKTDEEIEKEEEERRRKEEEQMTPEEKRRKFISRWRWRLILATISGTIIFLFYESHLRSCLPYRLVMRRVNNDMETLKRFGGAIQGNPWYKCFIRPVYGYVSMEEGNTKCEAKLNIPIIRYVPPPLKEGETRTVLPEDEELQHFDGNAHEGYIRAVLKKRSSLFYDWKIVSLTVECDQGYPIEIVKDKLILPVSRYD